MPNKIELLLPARDLHCGKTAINHGADAVYIGAPAFGARQAATNSIQDIAALVQYAHLYGAKVHVTVNTLLFDDELEPARKLLFSLYDIGVDAVLIQDLGILKLDPPPLAFHASTQCHNSSIERISFLEKLGFSRVVLARETDLPTMRMIRDNSSVELEAFVHGALCVSYSGQCYISQLITGRSGNRGECAQICRTRFDLEDANGKTLVHNKHLLSLRDMCRADYLSEMISAGISSFKVEGRLKNESYIKNITSFYRRKIDNILDGNPEIARSSSGKTAFFFTPDVKKSFNRDFTPYFIDSKREKIASFDTPKAVGQHIGSLLRRGNAFFYEGDTGISNGDGLCFINNDGDLEGFLVNKVEGKRIYPHKKLSDFTKVVLYRNIDKQFERTLDGKTAERKIDVDIAFKVDGSSYIITACDEDGVEVSIDGKATFEAALQPEKTHDMLRKTLSKLGNTCFHAKSVSVDGDFFVHSGFMNELKGRLVELLSEKRLEHFRAEDRPLNYTPEKFFSEADYLKNITNEKHREVYEDFGATKTEFGLDKTGLFTGKSVMTCKYCIRHELGWCSKNGGKCPPQPLKLVSGKHKFTLQFDCKDCVMKVVSGQINEKST
ncbi:MAG: U32 family peptidase [Bacteroidales bacterium]|nr:U32 family peptidase [Bacteroidales bacterium]